MEEEIVDIIEQEANEDLETVNSPNKESIAAESIENAAVDVALEPFPEHLLIPSAATMEFSAERQTSDTIEALKKSRNEPAPPKLVRFPLSRVKHMMKMDPECGLISVDAVFLVSKATELFLEYMGREAGKHIGKRKTVLKKDIDVVIESVPELCFLDGALE